MGTKQAMTPDELQTWVDRYEDAWRSPGTDKLADLFAPDASYLADPFHEPIAGLEAIAAFWAAEREGPDEVFEMRSDIVAIDGRVGVLRLEVTYGEPVDARYRDLWIVEIGEDGRAVAFEEWPFWPERGRVPPERTE